MRRRSSRIGAADNDDAVTTATAAAWKSGMNGYAVMNCL
jgi:hypothetical protein